MFGFIISWFLISTFNLKKRIIYGIIIFFLLGFSPQFLGYGYYGFKDFKRFLNPKTITYYREVVYAPPVQPSQVQSPTTTPPTTTPQTVVPQPTTPQPTTPQTATPQTATPQTTVSQPVPPLLSERRSSSILVKTGFENPITFIKNTSLSFIYSLLGPFPWQLTHLKHLLVLPEVIAWYFLLFFIIKGIIESIKKQNKIILPLVLFSCLVLGVLATFINNFGIITRIRIPAFLSLLCLFPLGFKRLKNIKTPFLKDI